MQPDDAIDLVRSALWAAVWLGGPILAVGFVVSLLVGFLQSLIHVNDQTVAIVPKIMIVLAVVAISLPWLADRFMDYASEQWERPAVPTLMDRSAE